MTLWAIFGIILLGVLALLLVPLLRRQTSAPARIAYDTVVYRDQLAEVDRDVERGLLSGEQAEAAKTEILRRMLAAEDAELESGGGPHRLAGGRTLRLATTVVLLAGLPLGAFAIYGVLGSPGLPGQPFAGRQSDPSIQMAQVAERLAAELQAKPEADGFVTLGETYFALRRYREAAAAFRQAIESGLGDAELLSSLGESITLDSRGEVVPEARQAFMAALRQDSREPRARFYIGLARVQIGQIRVGVAVWRDLEKDSAADAPWLKMLREHIAVYARQGGFDPATVAPAPVALDKEDGGAAGPMAAMPSGDAAAAVMSQSPEEQQKTIKSMVDGLAARLEQDPDDFEGWVRLARSYKAMNELPKARQAAERAVKLKPKEVEPKLLLAQIQLASAKSNQLPPDFVDTMRAVLLLDPNNGEAMYYVGAAEAQAGRSDQARRLWSRLLEQLPQDSPNRPQLLKRLSELPKG